VKYPTGRGVRRRSSRHRRHRQMRLIALCLLILGLGAGALRLILSNRDSASLDLAPTSSQAGSAAPYLISSMPQPSAGNRHGRPVYRYSVIPGGVQDAAELQRVSAQDRIVAAHFAGFDYARGRVVRLQQAREVYLSYRMGDRVFWTRKKVRLAPGEKVISDGKMVARTRCANRVSETKQAAVSPEEPPSDAFERPMGEDAGGMAFRFPSNFDSALLGQPQMPGVDPGNLIPGAAGLAPLAGWGIGTAPPSIPLGACETSAQEKLEAQLGVMDNEKNEVHCPPGSPSQPPAAVPEPGTMLLVSSGLAGVYLRYRKKSARP
jgi:PEP-CTERM motif-containing protein